jgi:maltooligosyltrehalose trehalohydrolase
VHWENRRSGDHAILLDWHRRLLRLRRGHPLLSDLSKDRMRADVTGPRGLSVYRYSERRDLHLVCLFNFSANSEQSFHIGYASAEEGRDWTPLLSSEDGLSPTVAVGGSARLPPMSMAVYERSR